eukprot:TRINITY_DN6149_c0_g3_i1.p1 TRINITY_DN6149_c0_g3~~TRINITY_DN6149_c0_g3_i1.p1  ORF type:complete len:446 (-),score=51.60 TRINITY_DN6149_c0_g3_i1:83-1420(-)
MTASSRGGIHVWSLIAIVSQLGSAAGLRHPDEKDGKEQEEASEAAGPPVCDAKIIQQACAKLNENTAEYLGTEADSDASIVHVSELSERLMMSNDSIASYLKSINVANVEADADATASGAYAVSCAELCTKVIASVSADDVPPTSDVGCYISSGGQKTCDVDLSPKSIASIHFPLHQQVEKAKNGSSKVGNTHNSAGRRYEANQKQMSIAIARLFRVHLATTIEVHIGSRSSEDFDELKRVGIKSQAATSAALSAMAAKSIPELVEKWFGSNDATTRQSVRYFLSGALNEVLSNVEYRYNGPSCAPSIYAYVDYVPNPPACKSIDVCAKNYKDYSPPFPYIVQLCDLYFKDTEGGKIKTLVHEALHHYPMDVDNKTYGIEESQALAKANPADALDNADSLCYFVADANVAWAKSSGFSRLREKAASQQVSYMPGMLLLLLLPHLS